MYTLAGMLAFTAFTPAAVSQNNDSITVIQYQETPQKPVDTTDYRAPAVPKIQKARPDNFWRRVSVGGWLGFQFGSITSVAISPEVKVRLVDQLYLGLGFTYEYVRYNDFFIDVRDGSFVDFSNSIYGGRIFARYYLGSLFDNFLANVFFHAEYEYLYSVVPYRQASQGVGYLNIPYTNNYYVDGRSVSEINSIFVGGGYRQPIGGRAFIDFLLLFNLNDTPYSPYNNPLFRIGFGMGL